jgi:uncharacterized protein (TIGR03067 family)
MTFDALALSLQDTEARPDWDRLQGTWTSAEGRRPAEFTFNGRRFSIRFEDGDLYKGSFDLVPDERPRTMILWIEDGPAKHKGKTAMCIYEWSGDLLRWCPSEPGADDPPAEFPACDDRRHLCTVLQRAAARKTEDVR